MAGVFAFWAWRAPARGPAATGALYGLLAGFRRVSRVRRRLRRGGGDSSEVRVERCEGVSVNVFAADFEELEERLVEQAPFGDVGLAVGGLDVLREVEGEVERGPDVLSVDLVAAQEFVGGDALATDAELFFGEEVVADLVAVVRREKLPFLVREPGNLGAGAVGLGVGERSETVNMGVDSVAYPLALILSELDCGVVPLDGVLDGFRAVVGLTAELAVTAAADEVVVVAAVAAGADEEEAP